MKEYGEECFLEATNDDDDNDGGIRNEQTHEKEKKSRHNYNART